jgi:hypothetical protein
MAEGETKRRHRIKAWRQKRAAKAARTGDTAEKLAERRKAADQPDAGDVAARVGHITIIGGF